MKKNSIRIPYLLSLISAYTLESKVLIITHNYNRPEFIEIQQKTFSKFLKDDYEYVVFNDATDQVYENKINETCQQLGIRSIRIAQENRTPINGIMDPVQGQFWPGSRHAQAIAYSLTALGLTHDSIVMMIDSDMILIKDFSPTEFLKGYDIAGLSQIRGNAHYLWAGLLFFRMNTLPHKETMDFSNGLIDELYVDSGGYLHYYFQANPEVKILYFEEHYRHFFDKNLRSYILPSEFSGNDGNYWYQYLSCTLCKANKRACTHQAKILQDLGFGSTMIKYIKNKKMPPGIEFVMKDTFLHYQESTNYNRNSQAFHKRKTQLFFDFIKEILRR